MNQLVFSPIEARELFCMIPAELTPREIRLPAKGVCSIVVFTGAELRHDRFALRLQQEFGPLVVGWFQVRRPRTSEPKANLASQRPWKRIASTVRNPRLLLRLPGQLASQLRRCRRRARASQGAVEEVLFGEEVRAMRARAHLTPTVVGDPNAPEVVALVRSLNPYFLLTLGGAIYETPLLSCARGLALSQHDGWCPDYKGANTVDWTLYPRDHAHLGNTVHLLTSGLDAGPIVRRSTASIIKEDTRESCFARVVALGTELMCEVVAEAIRSDVIAVFDQPANQGFTYLKAHLSDAIRKAVDRDLAAGWIAFELSRLRRF